MDTEVAEAMHKCNSDGPLIIYVTKLYNSSNPLTFDAFGFSIDDEENIAIQEVLDVWIFESRKDELSEVESENSDDIGTSHNRLA
ncbi:29436_t:CDS:2 [Gigaspora margarita]|uniref:29436_t:CDS:1 n=1 Tax=Gigaspora margarita TaxID=4874 RepID=A0ABN7VW30_GIGMA|nr:29436_t:CDS:2 [Gigaspora margarita]